MGQANHEFLSAQHTRSNDNWVPPKPTLLPQPSPFPSHPTLLRYDDAFSAEEKEESRAVKKSVQLNLAAAHLKEGSWTEARKAATSVLDHDSFNLKALFRRAQAYLGTFDFVEAEQDIKKGLGVVSGRILRWKGGV